MSLTQKMLKAMGIEDEQREQILEAHQEVLESIKAERDQYKAEAGKVADLQKQLEEAAKGDSDWKSKYEAEHKEYEDYKAEVAAQKKAADTASAYRKQVLEAAGIAQQYMDDVMGVTKLDGVELDDEGNVKDADKLAEAARKKWGSFVVKTKKKSDPPENPPSGGGEAEGGDPDVARRMQERYERKYGIQSEKE